MGNLWVNLGRRKNPHLEKTMNDFCNSKRIWMEIWQKAIYVNLQKKFKLWETDWEHISGTFTCIIINCHDCARQFKKIVFYRNLQSTHVKQRIGILRNRSIFSSALELN